MNTLTPTFTLPPLPITAPGESWMSIHLAVYESEHSRLLFGSDRPGPWLNYVFGFACVLRHALSREVQLGADGDFYNGLFLFKSTDRSIESGCAQDYFKLILPHIEIAWLTPGGAYKHLYPEQPAESFERWLTPEQCADRLRRRKAIEAMSDELRRRFCPPENHT